MGLMGSALGRGLAGAGAAAAGLASKYIDEELAQERAKFLADLQHQQTVRTEEYTQSAPVQARRRENATAATLAQGAATRQSELEGLTDTTYQGARRAHADQEAADGTRRDVEAIKAKTPAEVERASLIARAQQRAQAAGASQAVLDKVAQMEKVLGRKLTEEERLLAVGLASKPKSDADLVEVEEEIDDGSGKTVKRKWKEGKPKPPTEEQAHAEAAAAIGAGAPRDAVNAELRKMGFKELPPAEKTGARPRIKEDPPTPADELRAASTSALQRLVDMNDPRAAAAKAELRRRKLLQQTDIPVPGGA